ncbi:peptide-methionine (S)-S-oxide reductase MsrA [Lichenifustis flavocetrariae]|uniref:Peptide methionine sulfoxide reductase MsrA n=1 Tax=Lichenifustis flavocetrariae TaxID=2949735 RepID=A0AA41YRA7_9HYPH|nr:peptide-methionine (S)-S-oxide reductase MsrA [Lichenifustis flavocetrariae]MCW6506714.1 peptide-methionine (S)-S-oxide reductase MsrA [Lichenifustis flavocetrariae]
MRINTHWISGRTGRSVLLAAGLVAAGAALGLAPRSFADEVRAVPAPAVDETPNGATSETAVLAGGCFWGVQGVYQHVQGVTSAVSGYAGGDKSTANYDEVSEGTTGHAESVKITFDPRRISYGKILQIYFSAVHNPTELNRQGPDSGTQYRSAVFPTSDEQARVAKAYKSQLGAAHVFDAALVTKIEPGKSFYPAEAHHQDFLARNPTYPYIAVNDIPKVEALKRMYPDVYRADPVLVAAAPNTN